MGRTSRHLSTQIKYMTILHLYLFICSTPYLLPFKHYDSNSFIIHSPGHHYLLTLQFHYESGCHRQVDSEGGSSHLPLPFPYHHFPPNYVS